MTGSDVDGEFSIEVIPDRPPPEPYWPEEPWRPSNRVVAMLVAAAVLIAAGGVVGLDVLRRHLDTAGYSGGLQVIAGSVPLTGSESTVAGDSTTRTAMVGDLAVAETQATDGAVWLSSLDLRTGKAAWPPVNLGVWDEVTGVEAAEQAIVVFTYSRGMTTS